MTLTIITFLLVTIGTFAQSIWDAAHLARVKQSLNEPTYSEAYQALLKDANKVLELEPLSVMLKERIPPSGDKHDYMSQARYFWPDSTKPEGKPYINRDGISNPELDKLDRNRLGDMANRVTTLSLAWYFSGDEKYAQKATELIRVWFFKVESKMNPHLNFAQIIPGHNNDQGRCSGVIDTYTFVEMLDGVQLLEQSETFTNTDSQQLKAWFGQLLNWILTSDQGREEASQKNNHSVAHDAQVIAFALYSENETIARKILAEFSTRRIFTQIEPDGSQPQELRRTLSFGYSQFNLHHMIDVFLMGQRINIHIDNSTSDDGRNFYKAVDFLTPYLGKAVNEWPFRQISDWEGKQKEFICDLYRIYLLNPSRTDYLKLFNTHKQVNANNRFNLIYLK